MSWLKRQVSPNLVTGVGLAAVAAGLLVPVLLLLVSGLWSGDSLHEEARAETASLYDRLEQLGLPPGQIEAHGLAIQRAVASRYGVERLTLLFPELLFSVVIIQAGLAAALWGRCLRLQYRLDKLESTRKPTERSIT